MWPHAGAIHSTCSAHRTTHPRMRAAAARIQGEGSIGRERGLGVAAKRRDLIFTRGTLRLAHRPTAHLAQPCVPSHSPPSWAWPHSPLFVVRAPRRVAAGGGRRRGRDCNHQLCADSGTCGAHRVPGPPRRPPSSRRRTTSSSSRMRRSTTPSRSTTPFLSSSTHRCVPPLTAAMPAPRRRPRDGKSPRPTRPTRPASGAAIARS